MRIGEVVLWILADLCNEANQQYKDIDPPMGMESNLKPFIIVYEVYLRCLGRRIRGVVVIAKCACEELP